MSGATDGRDDYPVLIFIQSGASLLGKCHRKSNSVRRHRKDHESNKRETEREKDVAANARRGEKTAEGRTDAKSDNAGHEPIESKDRHIGEHERKEDTEDPHRGLRQATGEIDAAATAAFAARAIGGINGSRTAALIASHGAHAARCAHGVGLKVARNISVSVAFGAGHSCHCRIPFLRISIYSGNV